MKRNHGLLGAAALLLAAVFIVTGCPMDGGGTDGTDLQPPAPGAMPALPTDSTAVGNETEAKALLTALKTSGIFNRIENKVRTVIEENGGEEDTFTITDKTSGGVKVSASGTSTETGALDFDSSTFTQGQSYSSSEKESRKATLTEDYTESSVTVLKDSVFEKKDDETFNGSVTAAGNESTAKFTLSQSYSGQYAIGFVVKAGGKAAKISLDAKESHSAQASNKTWAELNEMADSTTYSGSLTVYGANDAEVYKLPITDEDTYYEAMAYFMGYDDH
jgi:hypothetical protein